MKIDKITRANVRVIRDAVQRAINEAGLANEFALDFKVAGGRFGDNTLSLKLEVATINEKGETNSKERQDFLRCAEQYGLHGSDLGRTFTGASGRRFTLTGMKPARRKYPFVAERDDGRTFKFAPHAVRAYLDAA